MQQIYCVFLHKNPVKEKLCGKQTTKMVCIQNKKGINYSNRQGPDEWLRKISINFWGSETIKYQLRKGRKIHEIKSKSR